MDELRYVIMAVCVIAIFSWWRAGRKNVRFVLSRWSVMLIPAARLVFYAIKFCDVCTPATLNQISSGMILWTMIVLAIWGWMVADE